MWLDDRIPITKRDFALAKPLLNSAGMLGFYPDINAVPMIEALGAFITHPISAAQRKPAANRVYVPFAGGFLLHTGLQNPGIKGAINYYQRRWAVSPLPIIVHLMVESPKSLTSMIRALEPLENVLAVELGMAPQASAESLDLALEAATGELPLVLALSPEQMPILKGVLEARLSIVLHLVSPRGLLPGPYGDLVAGRLYGPGIFPFMLEAARELVGDGFRVIADGGVYAAWQARALMDIGVEAVGLGAVLWQVAPGDLGIQSQ
jgi:dihydroorotate dehydrogenase